MTESFTLPSPVCSRCDAVLEHGSWRMDAGQKHLLLSCGAAQEVVCPACQQVGAHLPEGIVTLRGAFLREHQVEILHLIRNEADEALADHPLERIIEIHAGEGELLVETTSHQLAQRIGRSLYRAYQGDLDYHWGDGSDRTRVDWERGA